MRHGFIRSAPIALVLLVASVRTSAVGASQAPADAAPSGPCVALVIATVEGASGSATDVGVAVRDLFASFLKGPTLRTVTLESRLASLAMDEAKQKQCPDVLLTTVTLKRAGKSSLAKRIAGEAGWDAAWYLPYGGTAGGAVAHAAVVSAAETMSVVARSTKAHDEIQLEYHVATSTGTKIPSTTKQAKAKTDGEDLLTGLVRQASEAIVGAMAKAPSARYHP